MATVQAKLEKKINENLKQGASNRDEIFQISCKDPDSALAFFKIMDGLYSSALERRDPPIDRFYILLGQITSKMPKPLATRFLASETWSSISEMVMTNLDLSQPIDPRFKKFMQTLAPNFETSGEFSGLMQCVESMQVEEMADIDDPFASIERLLKNLEGLRNEYAFAPSEAKKREMELIILQFEKPDMASKIKSSPKNKDINDRITNVKNYLKALEVARDGGVPTIQTGSMSLDELMKEATKYRDSLKAKIDAAIGPL